MRFAVERADVLRRAVVLRPPRFAVVLFAVRLAVVRFAVALRRGVARFAVFLRPLALAVVLRRVVLRPAPVGAEALIGEGGGGVGFAGSGVGQTEPGSFCADQSVPSSSSMVPPQKSLGRSRDAYRIPVVMASTELHARLLGKKTNEDFAREKAAPCREPRVATRQADQMRRLDLA